MVVELIGGLSGEVAGSPETQFVVLADIFGGSVCNQCLQQLSAYPNVKMVSGLSLPLALSVLMLQGPVTDEQLSMAVSEAREGVRIVEPIVESDSVNDGADDFF